MIPVSIPERDGGDWDIGTPVVTFPGAAFLVQVSIPERDGGDWDDADPIG